MSMAFSKKQYENHCGEGEQSCVLCRRFPSFCPIESNENAFEMAERAELLKRLEDDTISEDKKMLIKKALGMEHSADDSKKVEDAVNHPAHYTQGGIECIEALKAATVGLEGIEAVCTANAIKYLWRWKCKNGVEDINKAIWYLKWLKQEVQEDAGSKID